MCRRVSMKAVLVLPSLGRLRTLGGTSVKRVDTLSLREAEVTELGYTDSTRHCEITALGGCAWGRSRTDEPAGSPGHYLPAGGEIRGCRSTPRALQALLAISAPIAQRALSRDVAA